MLGKPSTMPDADFASVPSPLLIVRIQRFSSTLGFNRIFCRLILHGTKQLSSVLSVICLKVGNHDFDNLTSTPQGLDMQRMRLSLSVSRVYLVIFKSVSS